MEGISVVWEWKVVILKTVFLVIYFHVTDTVVAIFKITVGYIENLFTRLFIGVHTILILFFVSIAGTSELVMLSLDLVKTRLAVMSMEMRKNFIQAILTSLIEKSTDAKILRAVVKIVEEWVKNNSPMAANQVN